MKIKICIIHFLVTCCASGFVNFWSTKCHTQPCFRFVIPTNVIISSEELPHYLYHGSRPCLTTARTINPPDSPSYFHKFAWPIRFAVGKLLSALAVDPPCESLFQILSPPRIYSYLDESIPFEDEACRFCLNWPLCYTTATSTKCR